jgi:chromosome segregation ATPase
MKQYLSTALALVCTVLVVSLIVTKRGDDAQHQTDAGAITDFSNRLDSTQTQIAICNGTILTFSNNLNECQSALLTSSNQLMKAESSIALDSEQITNLNRQVAEMESKNQTLQTTLGRQVTDLTNQVDGLTKQVALTDAALDQAHKDYGLLENRLRQDVAARVIVERKFDNPSELKAQLENLKVWSPADVVSADSILAGLDVEVNSNGTFHVLSPN